MDSTSATSDASRLIANTMQARPATIAAVVALVVGLGAAITNYLTLDRTRDRVIQENALVLESEQLLSVLKDLETGMRGYLLSGEESFLEPYANGLVTLDPHVQAFRSAAIGAGVPNDEITTILGAAQAEREYTTRIVSQARQGTRAQALLSIQAGEGKRRMDVVRTAVGQLQQGAARRLSGLNAASRRSLAWILLSFAAVLACGLYFAHLARSRRKQSERSSALLAGVLENAPVGIGLLDRDLRVQHMNAAMAETSDRALGADIGKELWAVVPELRDELEPKIREVVQSGRAVSNIEIDAQVPGRPGQVRNLVVSFYPLPTTGIGLVVTDQTSRKRAEKRLEQSEERFRSLIQASAAIVWVTLPNGEFGTTQREWLAFTGQSREEALGWGWLDAVHPDDREATRDAWSSAIATRLILEFEHRLRRQDGEWCDMEVRAVPILDEDGSTREWVGVHTDISARKRASVELELAKEAAEEANRAKSQFLANMSHELRTPLSAVIGYSEMMAEEIEDLGEEGLLSDLRKIESNARHLLTLINDVLDISKIEANRMEVFAESFSVVELVHDVAATVDALIGRKSNTLSVSVAEGVGQMHSDAVKVRQCLLNLLSNASKFTEGGRIDLSVAQFQEHGEPWFRFSVSDTGIGMTPEQTARLFQRFSQADASTTRRFGGTGLGLAITRAFAEMLGGGIEVHSRPGEGTTFSIKLPALMRPPAPEGDASAASQGAASLELKTDKPLVLVIDDDAATRDLLSRFLARDGFEVQQAPDGQAGLDRVREMRPDVVLLDVTMPRLDGWSVLRSLRADPELASTPVIMVTILDEQNLAFSLGATDYLRKPVQWERLKQIMEPYRRDSDERPVLVVDDDAEARQRLRSLLERAGWTVAEAGNGREGLEVVDKLEPSVVLLDLMMPELDGFGFLNILRGRENGREIPIVVLTAKDLTNEDRARLDGRASRVLQKGSISLRDLVGELRQVAHASPQASGAPAVPQAAVPETGVSAP